MGKGGVVPHRSVHDGLFLQGIAWLFQVYEIDIVCTVLSVCGYEQPHSLDKMNRPGFFGDFFMMTPWPPLPPAPVSLPRPLAQSGEILPRARRLPIGVFKTTPGPRRSVLRAHGSAEVPRAPPIAGSFGTDEANTVRDARE